VEENDHPSDPSLVPAKPSLKELWDAIAPVTDATPPIASAADPVFPSLDSATPRPEAGQPEDRGRDIAVSVPMARNVFALALLPRDTTKAEFLADAAKTPPAEVEEGSPAWLDEPERDRIRAIAEQFVRDHVRRIDHQLTSRTNPRFGVGTLLVAGRPVPHRRLRQATFDWAITNGRVVELDGARLPVAQFGPYERSTDVQLPDNVRGDQYGLSYLLAYVLDMLELDPPAPIAAIGAITFTTNHAGTVSDIGPYLDAAQADGMHDLVLPQGNAADVRENGVRYWSVRDANEAVTAVLMALSCEVVGWKFDP